MAKRLRSGYTTGACAAAAAKAATLALLGDCAKTVEIPFPDTSRVAFGLCRCLKDNGAALASVVKDAGDDPDVTNGAEIVAQARKNSGAREGAVFLDKAKNITLRAGVGVGTVTKPGLAVAVGEPAINPVPRRMILAAVSEALAACGAAGNIEITISVPAGEELAAKTLNHRLGIVGGLSILGTTGIVRPVSAEAWTATIATSMNVARELGIDEIVLSTGRTSERGAQAVLALPEEAYAMMGDYLEFSLLAAARHGFKRIHLAAMWAKVMKGGMAIPQTHVRHGALEAEEAVAFLRTLGVEEAVIEKMAGVNTAREIYERLSGMGRPDVIEAVCRAAKGYAEKTSGLPVSLYLVDGHGKVVAHV
ncbi:MAG: cobalt-precorrin-5B (C(1))-methyltransferase CbiD [Desulfobulbaceae bacterium]|nr:cobalt-precorrin-5B (C(1))-methyltransferase CbiD [Desulfobulbaceae bacterium]